MSSDPRIFAEYDYRSGALAEYVPIYDQLLGESTLIRKAYRHRHITRVSQLSRSDVRQACKSGGRILAASHSELCPRVLLSLLHN